MENDRMIINFEKATELLGYRFKLEIPKKLELFIDTIGEKTKVLSLEVSEIFFWKNKEVRDWIIIEIKTKEGVTMAFAVGGIYFAVIDTELNIEQKGL